MTRAEALNHALAPLAPEILSGMGFTGRNLWVVSAPQPPVFMKVLSSLASAKRRHADCQVVKRKGTLYVINKTNPRFKARQGTTKGTKMSKKGVN